MSDSGTKNPPVLPGSLQTNRRLSQWLAFHTDGRVTVRTGKVDLGQGISTVLAQMAAEELDVDLGRICVERASTVLGPNEGMTAGSMSVQDSGSALRQACAEARAIYLDLAARQSGLTAGQRAELRVLDGVIVNSADQTLGSYSTLADDALLDIEASGIAKPKSAAEHTLTGHAVPRLDLLGKVLGQADFIHDMVLPGQLYGRVAHPPSPAAVLLDVSLEAINALPGVVTTVRDGSFIGVIAKTDYAAVQALKKLAAAARWEEPATLPDMHAVPDFLRTQPVDTTLAGEKNPTRRARIWLPPRLQERLQARSISRLLMRGLFWHMPPSAPRVRWRVARSTPAARSRASKSGPTAKAFTTCVLIWPWCWVLAVTVTTVPTMPPATLCCWRVPCRAARCSCSGPVKTN